MLIRKLRGSILAVFVLALFLSSRCVLAKEVAFKLTSKEGNATAIVKNMELNLTIDVGKPEDYPDMKPFTLTIGGCVINVKANKDGDGTLFKFHGGSTPEFPINDPISIIATASQIHFVPRGQGAKPISIDGCSVNFGERKSDGSYHVNVKLSGDDVPGVLKLTSKDAKMEEKEPDTSGLKVGLIVGGSIGAAIIVLLGLSIIGFFCYRCRKAKSLREEQEQLSATKNFEAAKVPEPVVKPVEEKAPEPVVKPPAAPLEDKKSVPESKSESKSTHKPKDKPKVKPKVRSNDSSTAVKPKVKPKTKSKGKSEESVNRKLLVSGKLLRGVSTDTATTTQTQRTATEEFRPPVAMRTPSKDSEIILLDCDVSAEAAKKHTSD